MSTIWTGDILGRPRQILLGSTVIAIGAVIQTASWSVAQMMVGRIVAGLGTGMNTGMHHFTSSRISPHIDSHAATAGVWQAETSKMRSRGKLVIIQMGRLFLVIIPGQSVDEKSKLHYRLLYLQLAYTRLLLRPERCCLALPAGIPNILHVLHLCALPISPRLSASSYPKRKIRRSV